jgi:hypothetical protein
MPSEQMGPEGPCEKGEGEPRPAGPRTLARRARTWLPALFFIGGFAWDAVTLGRTITPLDLFILAAYLAGAALILVVLGRKARFRGAEYAGLMLQFLFGGIFSALFIFYFLSSSDLPGYLVVLALASLLIGNEFLESAYSELSLSWVFFTLSSIMFFNFALAHLFRSISTIWFYIGTAVAVVFVLLLRTTARRGTATIVPALIAAGVMVALHIVNAIPPVPLVKKEMLVAHDLQKRSGGYVMAVESPDWQFWRSSSTIFHRQGDERVYCFTSVFVPRGIETTLRHRWQRWDRSKGWVDAGSVPFRITGGREGGYRGYTYKSNATPGRWRVLAESEGGATVGIVQFEVVAGAAPALKTLRL